MSWRGLNSLAGSIAELGSTLLFIVATIDFIKSIIIALISVGAVSIATYFFPGPMGESIYVLGLALSTGMAIAAVYSIVIAYITKKHYREIKEEKLTQDKKKEMLKITLPDLLLSIIVQNYLSTIGLALLVLALLIYKPPS